MSFKPTLLLSILLLAGCSPAASDGPPRAILSGEVTLDGQPLPYGMVRFIPEAGSGLPVSGAKIESGRYVADNKGGVPVGTFRVEITGWRFPVSESDEDVLKDNPQIVPEKYHSRSTLQLVVKSPESMVHDFHLE